MKIPDGETAHLLDAGAIALFMATVTNLVPVATGIAAFVWLSLRIYKTWLEIEQMKQEEPRNRREGDKK